MYVRFVSLILSSLLLTGCAGLFGQPSVKDMSSDQIKELAKIKDASVICIVANTPYGKGSALFFSLDKGVLPSGIMTIDDACKTMVDTTPKK